MIEFEAIFAAVQDETIDYLADRLYNLAENI
jgi:hypothetical protein